jgi:hypothetical protein
MNYECYTLYYNYQIEVSEVEKDYIDIIIIELNSIY